MRSKWMLSVAAAVAVLALLSSTGACSTITVPGDYATIGEAVAAASDGDQILVSSGVYTGPDNRGIDFGGKNLTLMAPDGPAATVIDCEGADRGLYFHTGEDSTSVVSGFTVRNGSALRGGGISCELASPIIEGCVFESNYAEEAGGGVYCVDADATVRLCSFSANLVGTAGLGHGGGGMQCNSCSPKVTLCAFSANSASSGGGLYCVFGANPAVNECVFRQNIAYSYHGAGMFCYDNSSPVVTDCLFNLNYAARYGGGMYCEDSTAQITSCSFLRNAASTSGSSYGGGGLCLLRSPVRIEQCEFNANTAHDGAGLLCRGDAKPEIIGCRIVGNIGDYGGGACCIEDSQPRFEGTLFENCVADAGGGIYVYGSTPEAVDCVFAGNQANGEYWAEGGGVLVGEYAGMTLESCAFIGNEAGQGGAMAVVAFSQADLHECTMAGNASDHGSNLFGYDIDLSLSNCLLAFGAGVATELEGALALSIACTDVYGNTGGDWTDELAPFLGLDGNISADPLFCGGADIMEAYKLAENSPCAPGGSPCGQMGKWGIGCAATAVEQTTWGSIKASYK